jgi:hypothetical protein
VRLGLVICSLLVAAGLGASFFLSNGSQHRSKLHLFGPPSQITTQRVYNLNQSTVAVGHGGRVSPAATKLMWKRLQAFIREHPARRPALVVTRR